MEANGYDRDGMHHLLESEGYDSVESLRFPPQGDAFGDLWHVGDLTAEAPTHSNKIVERFRNWSDEKCQMRQKEYDDGGHQHPVEHSYSYKSELRKWVRFKDVERHFIDEYLTFTTILLTYARPRSEEESIVEHANSFYPEYPIKKKRRNCIKATGYWEEFAGVSLLAPKDVAPSPCAEMTHAHDMLLIPSFVSAECFNPLQEEGVDVSIWYHRSDKVEAPSSLNRLELERERGETTALAQEVGNNLPVLTAIDDLRDIEEESSLTELARSKAKLDATDCPEYVEYWCAHMSCGKNGEPDTSGVRRWRPLGRLTEITDTMKEDRGYSAQGAGAQTSSSAESDGSVPSNR